MHNLFAWCILIILANMNYTYAKPLTPPREPKIHSYYVCYEKCQINYTIRGIALPYQYRKYQYIGCSIETRPCNTICWKKGKKRHKQLKIFDWFETYPQALNAFYRCAYS